MLSGVIPGGAKAILHEKRQTSKTKTMKYRKRSKVVLASIILGGLAANHVKAIDASWNMKGDVGPAFVDNITTTSTDLFGVTRTTKSSFKTGVRLDLDGGYQFDNSWAVEAEVGYIYNPVDFSNSSASASPNLYQLPFLFNGIYTLPFNWPVKPYIGAGVGLVFTGLNDLEDVNGAGQVMAGVKYDLNKRVDLALAYKFLITTDHDWNDLLNSTHSNNTITHSILATLTYKF
jgi:opacity protein-like surface antigen